MFILIFALRIKPWMSLNSSITGLTIRNYFLVGVIYEWCGKYNGIPGKHSYLFLAECEFRFNYESHKK